MQISMLMKEFFISDLGFFFFLESVKWPSSCDKKKKFFFKLKKKKKNQINIKWIQVKN